MTKKILAALLVVIMVVSMFPATVFAANSGAPTGATCVVTIHTKEACEKAGVKYVKIEGSTREAKCGQDGHTMYECTCGVRFLDDIVKMPSDHTHKVSAKPATERVEPTCVEYGKAAFYKCDNCDELYPEYASAEEKAESLKLVGAPAGAIAKVDHDWNNPDCTDPYKVCKVCGKKDETVAKKEHTPDLENPHAIVKAPDTCKDGLAIFKCKDCKKDIELAVRSASHSEALLTKVDEVPSNCVKGTKGVAEHLKCEECGALFVKNEITGYLESVTAADLVTEVKHGQLAETVVLPTCTSNGYKTYQCLDCRCAPWNEDYTLAFGHTSLADALAHDADPELVKKDGRWVKKIEERTCTTPTTYYWECQNYLCGSKEANVAWGKAEDAKCPGNPDRADGLLVLEDKSTLGHKQVSVKIPATHENPYDYTIVYCTDPECPNEDVKVATVNVAGIPTNVDVDVKVLGNHVFKLMDEEVKNDGLKFVKISSIVAKTIDPSKIPCTTHFFKVDEARNMAPTCTEAGEDVYICEYCLTIQKVALPALGHDWSFNYFNWFGLDGKALANPVREGARPQTSSSAGATTKYSCTGTMYLECGRCSTLSSKKSSGMGHVYLTEANATIENANCLFSAGEHYCCVACCGNDDYDCTNPALHGKGHKVVNEIKANITNLYDSLEDAIDVHGELIQLEKSNPGNCTIVGNEQYYCSKCDSRFWVIDRTTGRHYNAAAEALKKEEATCEYGIGLPGFFCERVECQVWVPAENKPLDHILTVYEEVKATCTTDGNVKYYTCSRECCQVKVDDVDPDKDGNQPGFVPIKYVLNEANGKYEAKSDAEIFIIANGHTETKKVNYANCVTPGFTYVSCDVCEFAVVTGYEKATGHDKGAADNKAATCVDAGYTSFKCKNSNCSGDDGIVGNDDDGRMNIVVIPAKGHMNQKGETFTNKCTDTIEDRACVVCNKDYESVDHKDEDKLCDVQNDTVESTCTTPKYSLNTCKNGCGLYEVKIIEDAKGHKMPWGDFRSEADYVDYADAKVSIYEENAKTYKDNVLAYTAPSIEKAGSITFNCADCGEKKITMPVKIVGASFSFAIENAVVPGANAEHDVTGVIIPVDGDVIAVDVNMDIFETKMWGMSFDITYNAYALNFLGYKFQAADKFANYKVANKVEDRVVEYKDVNSDGINEVVKAYKGYNGKLSIAAYSETDMNGNVSDVTVSGTVKVVTLYFQVEAAHDYVEYGIVDVKTASSFALNFDKIAMTNADAESIKAVGTGISANIAKLMDTNPNAITSEFNITDLLNCNKILKGQADYEYLAAADVNKDGKVTATDLDLMNKALVGEITDYEVYAALAWATPEGFIAAK